MVMGRVQSLCTEVDMRVAVSGTIGAGKSTLCRQLSDAIGFSVFAEPVTENPYLDDFYADPERWAFDAQVFMISHRFRRQMEAAHSAEGQGFLLDRCFHEDRVFAEVNHELGHISDRDWQTYLHLYESFCQIAPPPEVVIYLRTSPEVAMLRIKQRGRASERDISWAYLNRLHDAYDRWSDNMARQAKVMIFQWDDFDTPGWPGVLSCLKYEINPSTVAP